MSISLVPLECDLGSALISSPTLTHREHHALRSIHSLLVELVPNAVEREPDAVDETADDFESAVVVLGTLLGDEGVDKTGVAGVDKEGYMKVGMEGEETACYGGEGAGVALQRKTEREREVVSSSSTRSRELRTRRSRQTYIERIKRDDKVIG